jgi:hypothetical protein
MECTLTDKSGGSDCRIFSFSAATPIINFIFIGSLHRKNNRPPRQIEEKIFF